VFHRRGFQIGIMVPWRASILHSEGGNGLAPRSPAILPEPELDGPARQGGRRPPGTLCRDAEFHVELLGKRQVEVLHDGSVPAIYYATWFWHGSQGVLGLRMSYSTLNSTPAPGPSQSISRPNGSARPEYGEIRISLPPSFFNWMLKRKELLRSLLTIIR